MDTYATTIHTPSPASENPVHYLQEQINYRSGTDSSLRTKMVRVGQAVHHYLNLQLRVLVVVVKDGTD